MVGKWLMVLAVGAVAVAAILAIRRMLSPGYDDDVIDAAGQGDTFGERPANAPEQRMAPAETRTDVSVEDLYSAARVGASMDAIREAWPAMTREEITAADGDLDRLAQRIAEKSEQPVEQVRERLSDILATETPRPSYPAH